MCHLRTTDEKQHQPLLHFCLILSLEIVLRYRDKLLFSLLTPLVLSLTLKEDEELIFLFANKHTRT